MTERFELVQKALLTMLEDKKYATLRDILVTMNPSDVAGLFDGLEEKLAKKLDAITEHSWQILPLGVEFQGAHVLKSE